MYSCNVITGLKKLGKFLHKTKDKWKKCSDRTARGIDEKRGRIINIYIYIIYIYIYKLRRD